MSNPRPPKLRFRFEPVPRRVLGEFDRAARLGWDHLARNPWRVDEVPLARADDVLTRERKWPIILFALAYLLKLLYIIQSADALHVSVPIMDAKYYDEMAQDIAAGNVLRRDAFFMGPLYPYFLSLVYSIFGRDFMVVRLLQIAVGAATVCLTFLVGR